MNFIHTTNCRHCKTRIERNDRAWVHTASGETACPSLTTAGPETGIPPYSPSMEMKALGSAVVGAFAQGMAQVRETAEHEQALRQAPACPDHVERQHRDTKPPWCPRCGWTHGRPATPAEKLGTSRAERDAARTQETAERMVRADERSV